jgi:hypothetical protein
MNSITNPIEIWVKLDKDAIGYPSSQEWEQMYAWPIGNGFRIDNVPFFAKNVAVGDIVSAIKTDKGWYMLDRVLTRSGHSTFRIWLSEKAVPSREAIMQHIRELGGQTELTLERLIGIDAPPENESAVWAYLRVGRENGEWDLQVGFSPD